MGSLSTIFLALSLLLATAVGAAEGLRRLRCPGASLLGGLCAGLLLGPGLFGRIAPDLHIAMFEGDRKLLAAVEVIDRERAALTFVTGVPQAHGASTTEAEADIDARRVLAIDAWERERAQHRRPLLIAMIVAAATVLAASGATTGVRSPVRRHHRVEALLNAAWSTAVPIALVALLVWWRGTSVFDPSSLLLAGAMACGAWCVTREDRRIARSVVWGGAALIEQIARWCSVIALPLLCVALLRGAEPTWAIASIAALFCLPLGWTVRVPVTAIAQRAALPFLVAMSMLEIEPFRDLALGLAIVFYLIAEDGRWLGGWLGHWSSGRASGFGALRLTLAGLTVGPMIVVVVGLGRATAILDPKDGFSLLIAATAIAMLSKVRGRAAQDLANAEDRIASVA